jgi:hypothetical protein
MEESSASFLRAFVTALFIQRRRRNHESGEPSIPLGSESGKNGRNAVKEQMSEEPPPFPLSMLSCAMKRRIKDLYAEFSCAPITEELVGRFFLQSFYAIDLFAFFSMLS